MNKGTKFVIVKDGTSFFDSEYAPNNSFIFTSSLGCARLFESEYNARFTMNRIKAKYPDYNFNIKTCTVLLDNDSKIG